jgi:hypothetical protein
MIVVIRKRCLRNSSEKQCKNVHVITKPTSYLFYWLTKQTIQKSIAQKELARAEILYMVLFVNVYINIPCSMLADKHLIKLIFRTHSSIKMKEIMQTDSLILIINEWVNMLKGMQKMFFLQEMSHDYVQQ